jgi:molybdenum cofactor guanylyltransferase
VNVKGIVLAGGKSRRFGSDKALATLKGTPFIKKLVGLLQKNKLDPVVITNESNDYSFLNCPIERDLIPGKGPLGGLYTACQMFPVSSLLVLTCDMPMLTPPVLETLLKNHQSDKRATMFCVGQDRFQPFPGMYESSLSDLIFKQINENKLSIHGFLEEISEKQILTTGFPAGLFANVNEQKDLGEAVR